MACKPVSRALRCRSADMNRDHGSRVPDATSGKGKPMLLLFSVGEDRIGLDVRHVIEVIPYVNLKRLPKTPAFVAGLFTYRNEAVPDIDVSKMLGCVHVRRSLS